MGRTTVEHGQRMREKILEAIIQYIQQHGYPPTVREIGDMVGLKSPNSVHRQMKKMLETGMIDTDAGIGFPRAIRVPGYEFQQIKI